MTPLIQQIILPVPGLEQMQSEAKSEGYRFLETLQSEWVSGENRFDRHGEVLCGHLDDGILVAIGGLNQDPFLNDLTVGRIRRLYVVRAWRNQGLGSALLDKLLRFARQSFRTVRLRAESEDAARLYERKGFRRISSTTATHVRLL